MDQSNPSDECEQSLISDNDVQSSGWASGLSLWEEECFRAVEDSADQERQIQLERETVNQRLWLLFQASACSIAQLYKGNDVVVSQKRFVSSDDSDSSDRTHGQSMWLPFQTAASNVTNMFRECQESQKRMSDMWTQSGVQRRNREILSWIKKRKRGAIRQEELVAFICGKKHHLSGRSPRRMASESLTFTSSSGASDQRLHHSRSPPQTFSCLSLSDSTGTGPGAECEDGSDTATDLQPFRDALALSSLTTASAAVSSLNGRKNRIIAQFSGPNNAADLQELNAFMSEEFTRNMDSKKRPFPPNDVVMSSPTHKKPKFL